MKQVDLNWFHANKDYHDFFNFKCKEEDVIKPFLEDLNTNGAVWKKEGKFYPLILNKIMKRHGQHFDDPFMFRTFVGSNNKPAEQDDLKVLLDIVNNQHHPANVTKAHFLVGHENEYVRAMAESSLRGAFDDIQFNITETEFTQEDELKLEEK